MESQNLQEQVTSKIDELKALLNDASSNEKIDSLVSEVARLKVSLRESEKVNRELQCRLLKVNHSLFEHLKTKKFQNDCDRKNECSFDNIQTVANISDSKILPPHPNYIHFFRNSAEKFKVLEKNAHLPLDDDHGGASPLRRCDSVPSISCSETTCNTHFGSHCLKKSSSEGLGFDFCSHNLAKQMGLIITPVRMEQFIPDSEEKYDHGYCSGSKSNDLTDSNAKFLRYSGLSESELEAQGDVLGPSVVSVCEKHHPRKSNDVKSVVSQSLSRITITPCSNLKETVTNSSALLVTHDRTFTSDKVVVSHDQEMLYDKNNACDNTCEEDKDTLNSDGASITEIQVSSFEADFNTTKPLYDEKVVVIANSEEEKTILMDSDKLKPSKIPLSSYDHELFFANLCGKNKSIMMERSLDQTCMSSSDQMEAELRRKKRVQDKDLEDKACPNHHSISKAAFDKIVKEIMACRKDNKFLMTYLEELLISNAKRQVESRLQRPVFDDWNYVDDPYQMQIQFPDSEDSGNSNMTLTSHQLTSRGGHQSSNSDSDSVRKMEKQIQELFKKLNEMKRDVNSLNSELSKEKHCSRELTELLKEEKEGRRKQDHILEDERGRFRRDLEGLKNKYVKAKREIKKLSGHTS